MTSLEMAGATPQKQPKYTALFEDRMFTGLYTQRAVLHDPSDMYTARYGGRPDALLGGRNVELTNLNTLQRRPGTVAFANSGGGVLYPTPPNRAFSFQLSDGTIRVIIDTGSSGNLAVTSCGNASAGSTVYNGTFPGGGSNAFAGYTFLISGFVTNPGNNGTYVCTASSTTTLTLSNAKGVAETHAATAITAGAVYYDHQDSTSTLLFGKSVGAGQAYFISVAGVLYVGDGVDTKKYTPLNSNGTIWNWGIKAPVNQPSVAVTSSGAASTVWQASTVFSTMGLTKDTNATPQIWQVISVNADGSNTATSQFGTTGTGEPNWSSAPAEGNTVVDNSVTWTNAGVLNDWAKNTFYTDLGFFGHGSGPNLSQPGAINVASVKTLFGNFKNSGGLGNTGNTEPRFTPAYPGPSGGYSDNNAHWFAIGSYGIPAQMAAMRWKQSHVYASWSPTGANNSTAGVPGFIVTGNLPAPAGQTVTVFVPTTGGTSGSGYNPFTANATPGVTTVSDGQIQWLCLGQAAWQASTAYQKWVGQGLAFSAIFDGTNFQVCLNSTGSGLSGTHQPGTAIATAASISAANAVGNNTTYTLGAGSWSYQPVTGEQITISGFTNTNNNGSFQVVSSTTNTITVINPNGVAETHSATIALNPWGTGYGTQTTDGGITWTCVGPTVNWAASQIWNLPKVGFQPPSASQPFGGSSVNGANGFVQAVIISGTSGTPTAPSFVTPTTNPPTTTDGTITWQAISAVNTQSLATSFGLAYAYSFKARPVTDFYSPAPLGGGATPPGSVNLGAPLGSETNAISTASPVNQVVGANAGAVNTLRGDYSPDPQVDTIVIWRSADTASGADNMFELTEIPNVPALAGSVQWRFDDFLPSVATGSFPGLNILIPAPINDSNDPPPSTFLPMVYNYQRIWGANGQSVPFSGGPDTSAGNPNEAFNPADELPFLAPVVRLIRTPQGVVTFLTDSIEMIQGGPSTASFFSITMSPGVGLRSYNFCDVFAGEIYFFSSDNKFYVITPSLNLSNFGFALGDQFANIPAFGSSDATWNPATGYIAVHQNGTDSCIFIADGSTGWYRLNPHQVPGGMQGPEPIWSPFAAITGGAKMVQSVETSPGVKQLLIGPTTAGSNIVARSLTTFTDSGTSYDAFFTMGSIVLCKPGQRALLKFLEMDFSGVNYQPTISYLLNEVSGTFTPFVNGVNNIPQFDPPSLYGETIMPTSYSPNRYSFNANASLAVARHMQIKVDFGSTANPDAIYNLTVYGRLVVET